VFSLVVKRSPEKSSSEIICFASYWTYNLNSVNQCGLWVFCRSGSESDDEDDDLMSDDTSDDDSDGRLQTKSSSGTSRIYAKSLQDLVGQVLCIDMEDRGKKMVALPVLIVVPTADDLVLPSANHFLVRSFKDNKL